MRRFYQYFSVNHRVILERLSALTMPIHVAQSDLARRYREEKYVVRLSKSGKDLLLGWLTDGVGGEDMGSGAGIMGGERAKAGRDQVLKVINNCLEFHGMLFSLEIWCLILTATGSHLVALIDHFSKRLGRVHWPYY